MSPASTPELIGSFQSKSIKAWRLEVLQAIRSGGALHRYGRKEVIFHQGVMGDTVYAVESGLVELSGLNPNGREVTVSIRGPGEPFGWSECLLNEPRARQATVLQEVQIWQMSAVDFFDVLVNRPEIMLAALGSAVHRATRSVEMRTDLRGSSAYNRVAYVLKRLANSSGSDAAITTHLRITHDEISRICEVSRQTVTTILGEMQRNGLLELGLRSIHVLDEDWLSEELSED